MSEGIINAWKRTNVNHEIGRISDTISDLTVQLALNNDHEKAIAIADYLVKQTLTLRDKII